MYVAPQTQGPSFLSDFNQTKIFSTDFRNQLPTTVKFLETPSSGGTELFHVDRQIDRQTWYNSYSLYQTFRTRQKHPTTVTQFLTGNFTKIQLIIQIQMWKSIYSSLWSRISYGSIWMKKDCPGSINENRPYQIFKEYLKQFGGHMKNYIYDPK